MLRIILIVAMGGALGLAALYGNTPYLLAALALALPLPISMARERKRRARPSDEAPSAPTDEEDWDWDDWDEDDWDEDDEDEDDEDEDEDDEDDDGSVADRIRSPRLSFRIWLDELDEPGTETDDFYPSDERVPDDDPATRNRRIRESRRALMRAQQRRPAPVFTDEATPEPAPRPWLTRMAELSGLLSLLVAVIALVKDSF